MSERPIILSVFLASRRGKWTLEMLNQALPAWMIRHGTLLSRFFSMFTKSSWMRSELLYFLKCTSTTGGTPCNLCQKKPRPYGAFSRRDTHMIRMQINPTGFKCSIDEEHDKKDAWLFIRLDSISREVAHNFAGTMKNIKQNHAGYMNNFTGLGIDWRCRPSIGIGLQNNEDLSHANELFCSEMLCAFLQRHYHIPLIPCMTTPQMLLSALLYESKALQQQQYVFAIPKGTETHTKSSEFFNSLLERIEKPETRSSCFKL